MTGWVTLHHLRDADAISHGWTFWKWRAPPPDEIVECRRINTAECWLSFWVKARLAPPDWNIEGVVWRPVAALS